MRCQRLGGERHYRVGTITLPTGGRSESLGILDDGTVAPRTMFLQPWGGTVLTFGDWFTQGCSSVVLPADPVYPIAWFNSVGVGYWVYRNRADGLIQGLVPVAELHVNTPLTNRGDDAVDLLQRSGQLDNRPVFAVPKNDRGRRRVPPARAPEALQPGVDGERELSILIGGYFFSFGSRTVMMAVRRVALAWVRSGAKPLAVALSSKKG